MAQATDYPHPDGFVRYDNVNRPGGERVVGRETLRKAVIRNIAWNQYHTGRSNNCTIRACNLYNWNRLNKYHQQ